MKAEHRERIKPQVITPFATPGTQTSVQIGLSQSDSSEYKEPRILLNDSFEQENLVIVPKPDLN